MQFICEIILSTLAEKCGRIAINAVVYEAGCRECKRTPKRSDLVNIPAKTLKIRAKSVEIWAKSAKTYSKFLKICAKSIKYSQKWRPKSHEDLIFW